MTAKRVALVVAKRDGLVLFGKRSDNGRWTLPGGHLNDGEDPVDGARRELLEETGLTPVGDLKLIDERDIGNAHFFTYECAVDGTPSGADDPDEECALWAWFDITDGVPKSVAENMAGPKDPKKNITTDVFGIAKAEPMMKGEDPLLTALRSHDPEVVKAAMQSPGITPAHLHALIDRPRFDSKALGELGYDPDTAALAHPAIDASHLNKLVDKFQQPGIPTWEMNGILGEVAAHPAGNDALHQRLLWQNNGGPNPVMNDGLVASLLRNQKLSPDAVNTIYEHYKQYTHANARANGRLARHPNLSPDRVAALALRAYKVPPQQYGDFDEAYNAARNPSLPPEVLAQIIQRGQELPGPEWSSIRGTEVDPHRVETGLRQAAVQNPNLTPELAHLAIQDSNPQVPMKMFGWNGPDKPQTVSPAIGPEHVSAALARNNGELGVAAIGSPVAQPEHLRQFITAHPNATMWNHALRSPALTPELTNHMIDNYGLVNDTGNYYGRNFAETAKRFPQVKEHILSHPNLPNPIANATVNAWTMNGGGGKMELTPQDWSRLVRHPHHALAEEASRSPYLPQQVLDAEVARGGLPYNTRYLFAKQARNPDTLRSLASYTPSADETHAGDYVNHAKEIKAALAATPEEHPAHKWFNDFNATFNGGPGGKPLVGPQHRENFMNWARQAVPGSFASQAGVPQEEEPDILKQLAANKHTPPDILAHFAQHSNPKLKRTLLNNDSADPNHLRAIYHELEAAHAASQNNDGNLEDFRVDSPIDTSYRRNLASNANTPADVLHDLTQKEDRLDGEIIHHPNTSPETLRSIAGNSGPYAKEAREQLTLHDPDSVHDQSVNVGLGTNRLRKIRDHIQGQGLMEMHPKQLPAGDWSAGRNAKGNIDVNKLQEAIDKTPTMRYNVSHGDWSGAQRHNDQSSKVFQVNMTSDHVKRLKEAGVWDSFRKFHDATMQSGHPVTPTTLGWVRYTDNSDEDPSENPNASHEDRVAGWRRKLGREMERHGDELQDAEDQLPTTNDVECGNCDGSGYHVVNDDEGNTEEVPCESCEGHGSYTDPDSPYNSEQVKEMRHDYERMAGGDYHPDQGRHHPYINWARDHIPNFAAELDRLPSKNDAATTAKQGAAKGPRHVFIDEIQSDFGQSFSKQLAADAHRKADEEADAQGMTPEQRTAHHQTWLDKTKAAAGNDFTDDKYNKINSILFNGKKANEILGESFLQHLRDKGHHDAKVQIHSVKSKAPISLARPNDPVPGHFNHTYEELPKKLGFEPSTYGKLDTQDNEKMQGQPTHEGVVRKAEGEDHTVVTPMPASKTKKPRAKKAAAPAEPEHNLVGVHNLSAANLMHAHELGGLVAPSLAITHKDHPLDNFGEISLVAGHHLIDPEKNPVFDADVYSPRHPRAEYKVNDKAAREFKKWIEPHAKATGAYFSDLEDKVNKGGIEGVTSHYKNRQAMGAAFLADKGVNVAMPRKAKHFSWVNQPAFQEFKAKTDPADYAWPDSPAYGAFQEAADKAIDQQTDRDIKALGWDEEDAKDMREGLKSQYRNVPHSRVYKDATSPDADEHDPHKYGDAIEAELKNHPDFQQWSEEKTKPLVAGRYLPVGSRRAAYTPENILQQMTRNIRGAEGFNYGLGSARSKGAKKFRDMAEMAGDRHKIVSHEEFEKHKAANEAVFNPLAEQLTRYHEDPSGFRAMDAMTDALGESFKRGKYLSSTLKSAGFRNVPPQLVNKLQEFGQQLLATPTEYFESKPQRVVDLNEFHGAAVPHNVDKRVLDALKSRGVNRIEHYDKEAPGARAAAIQRIAAANKLFLSETPMTKREEDDEIDRLLRHPNPAERSMALKLRGVGDKHLTRAFTDEDPSIQNAALRHPALGTDGLLSLMQMPDREHLQQLALAHPRVGRAHIEALYHTHKNRPAAEKGRIMQAISHHGALDGSLIEKMFGDDNGDQVVENLNTPQHVIDHVIEQHFLNPTDTKKRALARRALKHPSARTDHVERAFKESPMDVKISVAQGPHLPEALAQDVLQRGHLPAGDPEALLRTFIVQNPKASKRHLDTAAKDRNPIVRHAAKERSGSTQKFERNLNAFLGESLKKAIRSEDMKGVRAGLDAAGAALVDHKPELDAHPFQHNADVAAYKQAVLDSPDQVKRSSASAGTGGNISRKAVYTVPATHPTHGGARYMVKPYHERISRSVASYQKHPHQGWAEMTNQALYHAGGIGNLHQNVHVAEHNMGEGHEAEPALVIKMNPEAKEISDSRGLPPDLKEGLRHGARRIAMMDFLTGNLDRHGGNLLSVRNDTGDGFTPMAIDHSRSFQYANTNEYKRKKRRDQPRQLEDSFNNYFSTPMGDGYKLPTAVGSVAPLSDAAAYRQNPHHWVDDWTPHFEWWGQNGDSIKNAMTKRLDQIKDPEVRKHIERNFNERADYLDERSNMGIENYGDDWFKHPVPLYRPGEKTDKEMERERWERENG